MDSEADMALITGEIGCNMPRGKTLSDGNLRLKESQIIKGFIYLSATNGMHYHHCLAKKR